MGETRLRKNVLIVLLRSSIPRDFSFRCGRFRCDGGCCCSD